MNPDATDEKLKHQAKKLNEAINNQVKNKVECYKDIHYNPNTKGADFEKVVASVMNEYLGSRFDFHTRAQVIDAQMQYLKYLPYGGNEIDVVGIFNSTTPKIVFKLGDRTFVPYDAVALVCEVKAKMTKTYLEDDLKKLKSLMSIPLSPNRFRSMFSGSKDRIEDRPFRLLVYFDIVIDNRVMEALLNEYIESWDAIFLVNKVEVLINKSLPVIKTLLDLGITDSRKDRKFVWWSDIAFTTLLAVIMRTIPIPYTVDVIYTLFNIGRLAHNHSS